MVDSTVMLFNNVNFPGNLKPVDDESFVLSVGDAKSFYKISWKYVCYKLHEYESFSRARRVKKINNSF